MGDGGLLAGLPGRGGIGSNDSIPGRRNDDWEVAGFAIGGGGFGRTEDWFTTELS